jgi:C1A family cysteine protease
MLPDACRVNLGWQRDLPDFRDYTPTHPTVSALLAGLTPDESGPYAQVDLREFFAPVSNHGPPHSSSADACIALAEYFERRSFGSLTRYSAPFLLAVSRRLSQRTGPSGVDLRTTLKALVRFGVPPATYDEAIARDGIDADPFLYQVAFRLDSATYFRLDPPNVSGRQTLDLVRTYVAAGIPLVFGFSVPTSLTRSAEIPHRTAYDGLLGGKAAVVVGYNNGRVGAASGALLIRSAWGRRWGRKGYGWLPYRYVEDQLAVDFWTVLTPGWLSSGEFCAPRVRLGPSSVGVT